MFLILNVLCCFFMGGGLYYFIKYNKSLWVKPSVIFLIFNYVFIQVPAALYSGNMFLTTNHYLDFFILSQLLPISILICSAFTFDASAKILWERLKDNCVHDENKALIILFLFIGGIVGVYLNKIGIINTGIYAILFDTGQATLAREDSLKLLDSPWIKYLYSIMCSAIAPMAAAVCILKARKEVVRGNIIIAGITLGLFGICIGCVSFPGTRWLPMLLVLAGIVAILYKSGFEALTVGGIVKVSLVLFTIALLVSWKREGVSLGLNAIYDYIFRIDYENFTENSGVFWTIGHRVFFMPMKSGVDYLYYANEIGFLGVAAIPKLASLFGVEPINVSNIMYKEFYGSYIDSGTYPTGFIYSYYCYFGPWTIMLDFWLIILLDGIICLYKYVSNELLIPVLSGVFVSVISLIQADFTTALLTHGVLSSVFVAIIVSKLCSKFEKYR